MKQQIVQYSKAVQETQVSSSVIQLSAGGGLTLTPEQEWLLVNSGLVTRERDSILPARYCDERALRILVDATVAGLVCSFCAAPKPSWRYPDLAVDGFSDAFVLPGHQDGVWRPEWLACDSCANLISRPDQEALARISIERSLARSLVAVRPDVRGPIEALIRCILDEFWGAFCGERERVPAFQAET